jgi:mannose-6-phosphate isomerase-like protein (cupin superfamily)
MTQILQNRAYEVPVDHARVRRDWAGEGFSFGVFRDPPGQAWNDFVHDTDEYVLVAEGEMAIQVGSESFTAAAGDLVRIPRGTSHSLCTLSGGGSVWLYGYGNWEHDDV